MGALASAATEENPGQAPTSTQPPPRFVNETLLGASEELRQSAKDVAAIAPELAARAGELADQAAAASTDSTQAGAMGTLLTDAKQLQQLIDTADADAKPTRRIDVSTAEPILEAWLTVNNSRLTVQLSGRIVGYQVSHLCWEGGKLVGLKTDRPIADDHLPGNWKSGGKSIATN